MVTQQPTIPTQQQILADFLRCTEELHGDPNFQFERVVRRWINCGHDLAELPLYFNVTPELVAHLADPANRQEINR